MSKIKFRKPHFQVGYTPFTKTQTFNRIVYDQVNLLKEPFVHYSNSDTYPYDSLPAMWVTSEPFEAFKQTLRPEERVHDYGRLILMYPHWKQEITKVDMRKYILLDGVFDDQFYLAIDRRAANRSQKAQKINEKFIRSISEHDTDYVNIVNKLLGANLSGQFTDQQTIDRMFLARERYWDKTQRLIDQYNRLKQ